MQWTVDQEKAITLRDCNVLVAAAAGSGKTAVLVERIIQLITDPEKPTDIDKMLITTFTEAAASKMKYEIAQALEKRLEIHPEDKNLSRQLVLLDNAKICTVHAFCMRLVRAGFQSLDIEPDFGIGDDGEMKLLLNKSVDALFEELYESGDAGFLDLMESYATARSDSGLREILLALYRFSSSLPFKDSYFDAANALYTVKQAQTHPWYVQIAQMAILRLQSCIVQMRRLYASAVLYDGMIKYAAALEDETNHLCHMETVLQKGDIQRVGALARSFAPASPRVVKGDVNELLKAQISGARSAAKELVREIGESCFPEEMARVLDDLKTCGEKGKTISRMVLRLDELFFEEKKRRGVLDFSDLEHMAVRLLCQKDAAGNVVQSPQAKEIAGGLDYILVDEFQDTNELQETIFAMISRGDNLFMVGDVKQSIYRFRHTNPYIFKTKKDTFSDDEGVNRRVIMSKNFRSRDSVIDGVNCVFERVASEQVGEITYDETERLNAAFPYPPADGKTCGGKTEILIGTGAREDMSEDEMEAHMIAQRIVKLLQEGYMLYDAKKQTMRPATYKDIVILMRSYRFSAPTYVKILESYGIPCYADSGGGYFENNEITFMLSWLKVIDNPYQDIELIAMLRGVLFGFDENELLQIRLTDKHAPFYDCVKKCACGEDALAQKCKNFIQKLSLWRGYVRYMSTYELIGALYQETDYDLFALGQPGGEYRRENLNMLFERARAFDSTGFKGLFNFITYVDGLRDAQTGDGDAKLISETQDVVRIMSIHKSKGLEFGVVFLAHATKAFNMRDLNSVLLMHKTLGLGFDVVDKENCYKYPSIAKLAIREKLRMENLSEELRILYVGMTRAREKLIVTGVREKFEFEAYSVENEGGALPLFVPATANCYMDWILPAMLMRTNGVSEASVWEEDRIVTKLFEARTFTQTALTKAAQKSADMQNEMPKPDAGEVAKAEKVLAYQYPYMADTTLPSKVSVTEVKRMTQMQMDPEAVGWYDAGVLAEPQFEKEEKIVGAARGSVVHFVMQHLDLAQATDEKTIAAQIQKMQTDGFLSEAEAAAVSPAEIAAFFKTPLGRRMCVSHGVQREFLFEIQVSAAELFKEYTGDAHLLLQGIIDCFFEENGEIVLLDYKTDRATTEAEIADIRARYAVQVHYYKQAIEQITGKRVKEKYLYLFSAQRAVEM